MRLSSLALAILTAMAVATAIAGGGRSGTPGGITEEQRRELERVSTLGYVVGGDPAPEEVGVTVHHTDAYEGYTVYVSRDFPGAFLVDMEGRILHSWHDPRTPVNLSKEWTRAWAYPDGSVLGITRYPAQLRKLDRDSDLLWKHGSINLRAHHDVQVEPDGTIYLLMSRAAELTWLREEPIVEPLVCILEPDGDGIREVDCIAIPEAFRTSEHAHVLSAPWFSDDGDPFHANSIEILRGGVPHPAFRPGNVLLSFRNIDCLAVLDPDRREIVWVDHGRWQRQHEARETAGGRIQLFDNRMFEARSRVVEYDVVSEEIVWSYTAEGFFSRGAGAQQELPNGNVLITESQNGRVFEVTRDGRVVWEYFNPRRLDGGRTIVRISRAFRVPHDYFTGPFAEHLSAQNEGR